MDKEKYLDMCKSLGSEPVLSEMPLDFDDLTTQSQDALLMFNYLPDKWNEMSGGYAGKDISNIFTILELFSVDRCDWLLYIDLLNIIIEERVSSVNAKIKREAKVSGKR